MLFLALLSRIGAQAPFSAPAVTPQVGRFWLPSSIERRHGRFRTPVVNRARRRRAATPMTDQVSSPPSLSPRGPGTRKPRRIRRRPTASSQPNASRPNDSLTTATRGLPAPGRPAAAGARRRHNRDSRVGFSSCSSARIKAPVPLIGAQDWGDLLQFHRASIQLWSAVSRRVPGTPEAAPRTVVLAAAGELLPASGSAHPGFIRLTAV